MEISLPQIVLRRKGKKFFINQAKKKMFILTKFFVERKRKWSERSEKRDRNSEVAAALSLRPSPETLSTLLNTGRIIIFKLFIFILLRFIAAALKVDFAWGNAA